MNGCKNLGTDCIDNNSPFDPCIGYPCYVPEEEEREYYNSYDDENYKD